MILLACACAAALLIVNFGFLFQGSFHFLRDFNFESRLFKRMQSALPGWVPVPLPERYIATIDRQSAEAQNSTYYYYETFLLGRRSSVGFWYYYFVLLALKTPFSSAALAAAAVAVALKKRMHNFETWLLLAPVIVLFVMFSFSSKQLGIRMLLPAAPLFWLWVASTFARANLPPRAWALIAALTSLTLLSSVRARPDFLAYFNPIVGDSADAYHYADDSNLDWGQDLIELKNYMTTAHLDAIQLAYYGRVPPEIYGINYEVPLNGVKPGLLAISVSLFDRQYILFDHGRIIDAPPAPRNPAWGEPVRRIGKSILVFRVP
jgi:hypothetical protein